MDWTAQAAKLVFDIWASQFLIYLPAFPLNSMQDPFLWGAARSGRPALFAVARAAITRLVGISVFVSIRIRDVREIGSVIR
jgi:hypothetical protein